MSRALWIVFLMLILVAAYAADGPLTLYVATTGNDAWSGQLREPGEDAQDGPLATLEAALEVARDAREPGQPVRIVLLEGNHTLSAPVELGPADSGLTIEGESNAVTLSGGRVVSGWKPWRDGILQADLSALDLPDLDFRELYCDGKLMPWARVPNFDPEHPRTGGFLQNGAVVEADTKTKFRYKEGDLNPERWAHPERAWMMFHDSLNYETQYCPVKSIDPDKRIVEAVRGVYVLSEGNPFYLCGILEELDAPGEWCVDPDAKALYFMPPGDDPQAQRQVVVPALQSAFVLKGQPDQDRWVENVRISRLGIRDFRGRAIMVTGARDCTVAACDLRNAEVGAYLGDDTHACKVLGCDITQTQGDGVSVIGTSLDHERVSDHLIDNNYIWDFGWGRIHNRCGGVYMHRCARVKVTHNHVHDGPRYAIGMDVGNDCEIAWNYGHHVNLVTADTGIIEAATALDWRLEQDEELARNLAHNRGNTIHHNLLHDAGGWGTDRATGELVSPHYSWGIYLDTHCSNWHVHHNVVYNTVLGGFMLNCGISNLVENNVFVDGQKNQVQWNPWTKYEYRDNRCERNVIDYAGKTASLYTLNGFKDEYVRFAGNLVHSRDGNIRITGVSGLPNKNAWQAWTARGQDTRSMVADPLFVDPAARDYSLKPDSPAFALGFEPIDLSTVGNYDSPDRRVWPRPEEPVVRDEMSYDPADVVRPTQPALRDYEGYSVGEKERAAHVGEEGALATIRVTDATAASGRQSLKFAEAEGVKLNFVPYCTYPLELESGVLNAGFDLRWETGAQFVYEWRDDPYTYNLGPQVTVSAGGELKANGKTIGNVQAGQWVRFDISCGLGPQNTGKYTLTIRPAGGEARVLEGVDHAPGFKLLNCAVVMSIGTGPATFYLDNVEFNWEKAGG